MEKKKECEIVQDLLLNYVDAILNPESQKWVEKHLIECTKCQEKLAQMRQEKEMQEENQKVQVDYLKKIRKRTKIKSILGAILIVVVIFGGWYWYQFSLLTGIAHKIEKKFESENFYFETISTLGFEEDGVMVQKTWYKNGKYKQITYRENGDEILQTFDTKYGNLSENTRENYLVNEEQKTVTKEKWFFDKTKMDLIPASNPIHLSHLPHVWTMRLGAPFYTKISTDHEVIGRLYYVLEMDHAKQWVDKQTGLPIMTFGYSSMTDYYKDTKIPLRHAETISEYHYAFETVTDEDVEMPDWKDYQWLEKDWEKEIQKVEPKK